MSQSQIVTAIVVLSIVFLAMRFNLLDKLKGGGPGLLAGLAVGVQRMIAGISYKQIELQSFDVAYLEGGSGEPVLLLHGFAGEKDDWTRFARSLRGKFRVVAPDLPGFGESSRLAHNRYDTVSQVRRVRAFKDKLNLGECHLVGCHTGGAIAGVYASLFPQEVLSLTLIEPFGIDAPDKGDVERLSSRGWSPLTAGSEKELERVLGLLYRRPPAASGLVMKRLLARKTQHKAFEDQMWKQIWEHRPFVLEQVLPEIKVRTLLFWGDSNKIAHASGAKLIGQNLPGVTTVLLKNCGHQMIVERAKEVAQRFIQFARNQP